MNYLDQAKAALEGSVPNGHPDLPERVLDDIGDDIDIGNPDLVTIQFRPGSHQVEAAHSYEQSDGSYRVLQRKYTWIQHDDLCIELLDAVHIPVIR